MIRQSFVDVSETTGHRINIKQVQDNILNKV